MSLTSTTGTIVDPPTIVQCKVLLAVGINSSNSRLKQLAQTIGTHSENLCLNNIIFGRVKQVTLSSFSPHSRGGDGVSPSPSPAPLPHHRHPYHHRNQDSNFASAISPAPKVGKGGSISGKVSPISVPTPASAEILPPSPAPAQHKRHVAQPPCHFGRFPRKANSHSHMVPARAPVPAPHITPSPHQQAHALTPIPHEIIASSSLPNIVYAYVHPPPSRNSVAHPLDRFTSVSPLLSSSSKGILSSKFWAFPLFLLVLFL